MLRKINQKVLDNLSYVVEQSVTFLVPFIVGINNENAYKNQTKRFKFFLKKTLDNNVQFFSISAFYDEWIDFF